MARVVVFAPEFDMDVDEAIAWLETKVSGLGDAFIAAVEHVISEVVDHPEAFREVRPMVHRAIIRKYRYLVFFRLRGDMLQFLGVVHGTREVDLWLDSRVGPK
ncbi:MAG: type II toxin-antitoxin system RelE/ParE family toxin [Planctomycetes bacterium]|nr:type II toxin-antitoxin system RelE/ParE family toxin [Planctomycetota bacterium]MCA8935275.1 type II toxin-antitoxin system RelE/ParE family toxin [Planctomycetota bacterium]